MTRPPRLHAVFATAIALLAGAAAHGDAVRSIYAPEGIAIGGYDAVSYFSESQPVPGKPEYAVRWRGATWYFMSPDTETSFEMNPEAYAPQFGGYCTYSISEGQVESGSPQAFFLYRGRLYLMHEADMLARMQSEIPAIVEEAESRWPAILGR